jgi:hypothetical protein
MDAETEKWLRVLPKPPHGNGLDDDGATFWLRRCYEAGGIDGLRWAWRAENWPLGPHVRQRLFHVIEQIAREDEAKRKHAAEQHARERQSEIKDARTELFRAAGWK